MLTRTQMDRKFAARALKAAEALTPAHAAAEAGLDADGTECPDEAELRRERIRHLADPYPPDLPEVDQLDVAEVGKRFNQAFDTPDGYPPLRPVNAEQFRRPPGAPGHAADSPGYGPPGRPVPVPSATLTAEMISRPALLAGQSRPCAPEAC
jgi:hypothetical protein